MTRRREIATLICTVLLFSSRGVVSQHGGRSWINHAGSYFECLKHNSLGPKFEGQEAIVRAVFRRCVEAHQALCSSPKKLQMVQAHPWGFGSAMNLWIQSFANALEVGLIMLPTGPFSYAESEQCHRPLDGSTLPFTTATATATAASATMAGRAGAGAPSPGANASMPSRFPGPECFFRRLSPCNESSLPILLAKSFAKKGLVMGRRLLATSARALHVTPGWVWGNLAAYMMEPAQGWARQEILRRSDPESLGFLSGRQRVGLHMRFGSAEAPIIDGRKRPRLTIDDFMGHVDQLTQQAENLDIYIITDQSSITQESLMERYRGDARRSTHRFILPERKVIDLAYFKQVASGALKDAPPLKGAAATYSVADVSLDLFADIEVLWKHVDYFIGSHSNLFFLVYGLRMWDGPTDRARNTCWVNTEKKPAPLNCPNNRGGAFRRSYDVGGLLALPLGADGSM